MRRSPRYRSAGQRIRRGFQSAEPVLDFVLDPLAWFIEHGAAGVRRRLHGQVKAQSRRRVYLNPDGDVLVRETWPVEPSSEER